MNLVIFDLDQTIVELFHVHNKATKEVMKRNFNVKASLDEIDFAGHTLKRNLEKIAILKLSLIHI